MNNLNSYNIINNLIELYSELNGEKKEFFIENKKNISTFNKYFSWPKFIIPENPQAVLKGLDITLLKEHAIENNLKIILTEENFSNIKKDIKAEKLMPTAKWIGMSLSTTIKKNTKSRQEITFTKISDNIELKSWFEIVNSAVFKNKKLSYKIFENTLTSKNFNFYVGKIDNKIVSTALVYIKNSTAGLYFIATKKDYRGNGLGTGITKFAINDSIEKGTTDFVLHATKLGKSIYEKLGFKNINNIYVFTTIN